MEYRIDLKKTNYKELDYALLDHRHFPLLEKVYNSYTKQKNFSSNFPLFIEEVLNPYTEVLGYYNSNGDISAFSLIYLYPSKHSARAEQFAWDYANPKDRLGYKSLRSECARYKRLGYQYLYVGEWAPYKAELQGFEQA